MTVRYLENYRHPIKGITDDEATKLDRLVNTYYHKINGCEVHRSPLKCIVNPVLRLLQFWRKDPYVIATKTEYIKGYPNFVSYTFQRVEKI